MGGAKRVDYEPGQWGPPAWQFLHTVTFGYPDEPDEEIKEDFWQFFRSLQEVLPCANCRRHYRKKLRQAEGLRHTLRDPFSSRRQLSQWVVELHNAVNQQNHKETVAYKDVYKRFNDTAKVCSSPQNTSLLQTDREDGEDAEDDDRVAAVASVRRTGGHRRVPSSRVVLVLFVVVVLLFLTLAVLAYLGCSCRPKKMGALM